MELTIKQDLSLY